MKQRSATLGVAVLTACVAFGLSTARAEDTPAPTPENLAGCWKLNPERSDDARQKMREAMDGMRGGRPPMGPGGGGAGGRGGPGGGGYGGGGRGGPGGMGRRPGGGGDPREAVRPLFEAPVELAITPTESEVVILEKDGRMRTLHPDGQKYKAEGGSAEVKTRWEAGKLLVETKTERGAKVTETFDVAPDRSQMIVTLRLECSPMPTVTIKRVYEPAEEAERPEAPPSPPGPATGKDTRS